MLGTSNRSSLDGLSPTRRFLEKSRRYRTERRHLATKAQAAAVPSDPLPVKGACRYCGAEYKRGLHFHERKCRPSPTS